MAMSMRFVNVRHRIANIVTSRRSTLIDSRIISNTFSHEANTNPSGSNNEDGEDFFGIPENFKLQHARHNNKNNLIQFDTQPKSEPSSAQSNTKENELEDHGHQDIMQSRNVDDHLSRRDRRSHHGVTVGTSFGTISFDNLTPSNESDTSTDISAKVQDVLTKLNTVSSKRATPSTINKENEKHQNPKYKNKMNLKQSNNTNFENKSHLNYIDEVYFPDHTVDQHISASLSEKLSQKRIIPEGTSIRPESFGRTESQSLKVHSSLTEEKFTADSRVRRDTSVKSSESSSVQSTNLIDEQYFGSVLNVGNKTSKQEIKDSFSVNNKDFKTDDDTDQHNANLLGIQSSVNKQEMDFNEVDHQYFGDNFHDLNPNKEMFNKSADMGTHPSTFFEIVKDYTVQPNVSIINQEILPENNSYQQKHNVQEKIIQNEASDKQELIEKTDQSQLNLGNKVPLSATTRDQQNFDKRRLNEASERQKLNNNTNQQVHRMKKEPLTSNVADQQKHNQKLSEAFGKEELAADSNILSSENFMKARKRTNVQVRPNLEKPETAYDLAMKIRNEMKRGIKIEEKPTDQTESVSKTTGDEKITDSGIKLDSKGYRVLDDQVPDLNKMTSADLVRMLKSKVIFDHEDFLAIDKPYGLPCISQQQDRVSVTELLPAFAEILPRSYKVSDLHLVHGLDRDVTGAIILAKNPEVAYILRGMYKNSDMITQRFWAITKGVPTPSAGLIDIPVGEAKVGNIYKMVLRPRYLKDEKMIRRTSKADSERAITQYKVLSSHMQSALVECTLLTNVKHQIRLHLASGLNTPILGDHKYSNFSKLAPQKLHTEMLDLLKIRQPMVRHLALHLHCRSVILKEYKGRMIFLTTYPPSHFRDNLRSLRIPKVQT